MGFVYLAMTTRERGQIPLVGMATTRRALRTLTVRYNDASIKALTCFVCGCIHSTLSGYTALDFRHDDEVIRARCGIDCMSAQWFRDAKRWWVTTILWDMRQP